jgi:sec-independent protein translocase protein TatA
MEILIILGIALLLFGAGRLADIGKGLGEGIRNFKKGIKDDKGDGDDDDENEKLPAASKTSDAAEEEKPAEKVKEKSA